jgi:hypothetical protein
MTPASIRNGNPGAQYPGPSSRRFGSTSYETLRSKDGTHKIATFPTPTHGAAALFDLLDRRYTGMSIEKAITKWCGGYYSTTYLRVLEDKAGVNRTDMLSREMIRDAARAVPFAKAMAWQEAGRDFPLENAEWEAAHAMAFGDAKAPSWDPENDVPTPKPETRIAETVVAVAKVGTAGTLGGGTVAIASPPDLSALTGWQGAIETGKGLVVWAQGSWPWIIAAGGAYLAIAYGGPWIKERLSHVRT